MNRTNLRTSQSPHNFRFIKPVGFNKLTYRYLLLKYFPTKTLSKKILMNRFSNRTLTKATLRKTPNSILRPLTRVQRKLTVAKVGTPAGLTFPNFHPAPIWTLSYLNSINSLKILGHAPTLDSYMIDYTDFLDERAPIPSFGGQNFSITSSLIQRFPSLDLNPRLLSFLNLTEIKSWTNNTQAANASFFTDLNVPYVTQAKNNITPQPYNYLGLPLGVQSQTSSPVFKLVNNFNFTKPQQKQSPLYRSNLYGLNKSLPSHEFDISWALWVKRALRFRKVDTLQLNPSNIKFRFEGTGLLPTLNINVSQQLQSKLTQFQPVLKNRKITKRRRLKIVRGVIKYFRYPKLQLEQNFNAKLNSIFKIYPFIRKLTTKLGSFATKITTNTALLNRTKFRKTSRVYLWRSLLSVRYLYHKLRWLWFHNVKKNFYKRRFLIQTPSKLKLHTLSLLKLNYNPTLQKQQQFSLLLTPISQTHRRKLTRLVTHSDPLLQKTNPFQTSKKIITYSCALTWDAQVANKVTKLLTNTLNYNLPIPAVDAFYRTYRELFSQSASCPIQTPVLSIEPLTTSQFTRSPLFFINLTPLKTQLTDVLFSIESLRQTPSYLVFPDANDLKVSIFRRLNEQKSFFTSRTLKKITLEGSTPDKLKSVSYTKHYDFQIKSYFKPITERSFTFKTLLSTHSSKVSMFPYVNPKIKRIRFKPGYGRIWRAGRKSIREILNLTNRYQYRLSPKLQQIYFTLRKSNFQSVHSTNTLGFALMMTRFAADSWSLKGLLSSGSVFLNGFLVTNQEVRLFVNDFIQLIVHIKFYIAWKWIQNYSMTRKNRVNKVFYRKFRPSTSNKDIKVVRPLPLWFYDLQYAFSEIPHFFEVDYFTLSVFVLYDELPLEKSTPSRARLFDPLILNMYNWKYIT